MSTVELASTFHHAGFIMRRELGAPIEVAEITPRVYRDDHGDGS